MKISARARYALAATIYMAQNHNNNEFITLISISDKLGISKIYLEQVFTLLKLGKIVHSIKGAQGGYQLTRTPQSITIYDILSTVETSLFDITEETIAELQPEIESAMATAIYQPLDDTVKSSLQAITLYDLVSQAEKNKSDQNFMFYI